MQIKMNSTKDVFLSLFRSRDDNLIWVASTLLNRIVSSATKETLVATRLVDTEKPNSPLYLLIGFMHGLLGSESEFRLVTIRSIGNLLQNLVKHSELTVDKLSPALIGDITKQATNRIDYLLQIIASKQNINIFLKMYIAALQSYE